MVGIPMLSTPDEIQIRSLAETGPRCHHSRMRSFAAVEPPRMRELVIVQFGLTPLALMASEPCFPRHNVRD